MAKLSELTAATTVADANLVYVVQSGISKKATVAMLRQRLTVYKTVDESVVSSTVLQDDDEIFLTVESGKKYEIKLYLAVTSGFGACGIKLTLSGTAVVANLWGTGFVLNGSAAILPLSDAITALDVEVSQSSAGLLSCEVRGSAEITTGGTIKLRWAQQTSNATATVVKRGSYMTLEEI